MIPTLYPAPKEYYAEADGFLISAWREQTAVWFKNGLSLEMEGEGERGGVGGGNL